MTNKARNKPWFDKCESPPKSVSGCELYCGAFEKRIL